MLIRKKLNNKINMCIIIPNVSLAIQPQLWRHVCFEC